MAEKLVIFSFYILQIPAKTMKCLMINNNIKLSCQLGREGQTTVMSAREGQSDKMSAWCQLRIEGRKKGKKVLADM